jgi:nucleoid-associated protein YgaU
MQGQTKLAVVIGAVVVGVGVWYVSSAEKKPAQQSAAVEQPADSKLTVAEPVAPVTPPEAVKPAQDTPSKPEPKSTIADAAPIAQPNASGVASPAPRNIEATGLSIPDDKSRPEPVSTDTPVAPISASDLPERTGLSSISPTLPPTATETPVTAKSDLPPNVDPKEKKDTGSLTTSTLKTSESTTTKPSEVSARHEPALPPIASAATAKPAAPTTPATGTKVHVVQAGDTYSSLAAKYLGSAKHTNLIMKANPGRDAKKLFVGAKINIPEAPADTTTAGKTGTTPANATVAGKSTTIAAKTTKEAAPPVDPSRSYTVQPGEGWMDLARRFLGNQSDYPELYELNKERVGGNPNVLPAGTVIELPKRAKLPAAKAAADTTVKTTAAKSTTKTTAKTSAKAATQPAKTTGK